MPHAAPPSMSVAGHNVHDTFGRLARYAVTYRDTVERYDLGKPGGPDVVSEDEVARTRVINSRIGHQDLEHFLRISIETTSLLAEIPITAHLREADPTVAGGLYDRALAVFDRYLTPGIHWGKISKVLHLKRPHLFPILDSRVEQAYRQPAEKAAARYPQRGYQRMYWAAVRDDLVTPANVSALASLRDLLQGDTDERIRQVAQLSDVRLLDILTWQP
jgi:hypothetical protein